MFFKKKKEKESKYTEGFNTAYFQNGSSRNPYNFINEAKEYKEWLTGFTDGVNSMNISINKNIFNYKTPKGSG